MHGQKKLIVFDLGGVIVDFNINDMAAWTGLSSADFWHRWLESAAVRGFEAGKTDRHTFSREIVAEFNLPISPPEFLEAYRTWQVGLYPQAGPLLEALSAQYTLACLSNTNEIIWAETLNELGVGRLFDFCFASHEMGCLKPDPEAYAYLLGAVPFAREEILFFDDNPINVKAAEAQGIEAYVVQGPDQAKATLQSLGLLGF